MSHTQESVLKALGKEAQISGGVITVYRGGKHTNVTKFVEGVFTVTEEGLLILDAPQVTADGVDVIKAPKKAPKKQSGTVQDAELVEDVLDLLESDIEE